MVAEMFKKVFVERFETTAQVLKGLCRYGVTTAGFINTHGPEGDTAVHHDGNATEYLSGRYQTRVHAGALLIIQKFEHTCFHNVNTVESGFILFGKNGPLVVMLN